MPFPRQSFLFFTTFLFAAPSLQAANELVEYKECKFIPSKWADGDSFSVQLPDGRKIVARLYFVDCMESSASQIADKRRIQEQARYFGVADPRTIFDFGKKATAFTAKALAKPFTIHTAFADARGRSGKPRYYAFVYTSSGKDLASLLVKAGLARAKGISRKTPDGIHHEDQKEHLKDLELVAALKSKGIWAHSDKDQIVAMREKERSEARALESIDDALILSPPDSPIDVNSASLTELTRTGLRESLADAVIRARPFESIDDLIKVRGIGPVTLAKIRPHLKVSKK